MTVKVNGHADEGVNTVSHIEKSKYRNKVPYHHLCHCEHFCKHLVPGVWGVEIRMQEAIFLPFDPLKVNKHFHACSSITSLLRRSLLPSSVTSAVRSSTFCCHIPCSLSIEVSVFLQSSLWLVLLKKQQHTLLQLVVYYLSLLSIVS